VSNKVTQVAAAAGQEMNLKSPLLEVDCLSVRVHRVPLLAKNRGWGSNIKNGKREGSKQLSILVTA
jgi:hypothetical protein